jgi:transcriptional regulator GlxA family with amidase domain
MSTALEVMPDRLARWTPPRGRLLSSSMARAGNEAFGRCMSLVRALADELEAARWDQRGAVLSLLRTLTEAHPERARDAAVARALDAMKRDPMRAWTVAELGRLVGLSRAAFARRFVRAVGEPPKRYLASLRLELAAHLLATTDEGLAQIAAMVGYASEFAFSRAFSRRFGVAPGGFRRQRPILAMRSAA